MDELMNQQTQVGHSAEDTYSAIRGCIITAQNKVASTVNTTMVLPIMRLASRFKKSAERVTWLDMESTCYNTLPNT